MWDAVLVINYIFRFYCKNYAKYINRAAQAIVPLQKLVRVIRHAGEEHNDVTRRVWRVATLLVFAIFPSLVWGSAETADQAQTAAQAAAEQTKSLGQRFGIWLSPLAILSSAAATLYVASRTIKSNRESVYRTIENNALVSRQRATFEYLSKMQWDKDFIEMKKTYLKLKNSDKKISSVAEKYEELQRTGKAHLKSNEKHIDDHNAIRLILNTYEAIAVAIDTGTLDEEMVKRSHQSNIVDTIEHCETFIKVTREKARVPYPDRIYKECQTLVERWKAEG